MAKKEKVEGYSALALARKLIFQRHQALLMGEDERLDEERSADISDAIDKAIEFLFLSWLEFRSKKRNFPHMREKWDRTKWEKKLVVGMSDKKYHEKYLERAGLNEGGPWNEPNHGTD